MAGAGTRLSFVHTFSSSSSSCFLPLPCSSSSSSSRPHSSWSSSGGVATTSRRRTTTSSNEVLLLVPWARKKNNGEEEKEEQQIPKKAKKERRQSNKPRPPVFTARIVILGSPNQEWGEGVRSTLVREGWVEERVQVLAVPSPTEYPEVKWMAYLREGLKLRNSTFVIAAPGPATGQVMRFLEKHPLRGTILLDPPARYEGRAWDYSLLRQHCPFFGLIYTLAEEDNRDEWRPPPEAEDIREGLGLAPFPFGIRATHPPTYPVIEALIQSWQFLESLGMGPIQLVGEDEEEEKEKAQQAAAAAAAAAGSSKKKKEGEEEGKEG